MQKENQDGSTSRVRHVPIKIESRDGNIGRDWQNNQQFYNQGNHHHQPQQYPQRQQYENHQQDHKQCPKYETHNDAKLESHDTTSSIDINYRPQAPLRPQSPSPSKHDISQQQGTPSTVEEHIDDRKSRSWLRGKNKKGRSRDRFNSAHDNSPNSDKLVNSPEPIPLPPPQQLHQQQQQQQSEDSNRSNKGPQADLNISDSSVKPNQQASNKPSEMVSLDKASSSPQSTIDSIKMDITNLLQGIVKFDGISNKCKDYRYLDEMLTRCLLNLDRVDCSSSTDLRQQRKAGINCVDQATDILQRKLQVNIDIQNLSQKMTDSK